MPLLKIVCPKVALDMEFDGALTIGRHISNSLPIPDTEISRRHAQIFPRDGEYFVSDLGSRNGIFINGEKMREKALEAGDEIALGMSLIVFDPPRDTPMEELLSPRGEVLWKKMPGEPKFQPFRITTYSQGELEEILGDWFSHPGSLPLLSLPVAAKFLDLVLRSEEWDSRKELCQGAIEFLQERIGGERLILMAADPKKKVLQAQAVIHPEEASEFQISKDILRVVLDGERAIYCPDCSTDFRFERVNQQEDRPIGSFVSAPIIQKGQHYGFLYADSPPGKTRFDFKSLIQTYMTGHVFARCIHWLNAGRKKHGDS